MPIYNVKMKSVTTVTYDEVEIEADDESEAIALGKRMVEDDDLGMEISDNTISGEATAIAEG